MRKLHWEVVEVVPSSPKAAEGPLIKAEAPAEPSPEPTWTEAELKELEEALYELEMTRGDWSKSR